MQEKAELLRRFVAAGENIKACESSIQMSKKQVLEGRSRMQLIAVKDMPHAPFRFSKFHGIIWSIKQFCGL